MVSPACSCRHNHRNIKKCAVFTSVETNMVYTLLHSYDKIHVGRLRSPLLSYLSFWLLTSFSSQLRNKAQVAHTICLIHNRWGIIKYHFILWWAALRELAARSKLPQEEKKKGKKVIIRKCFVVTQRAETHAPKLKSSLGTTHS